MSVFHKKFPMIMYYDSLQMHYITFSIIKHNLFSGNCQYFRYVEYQLLNLIDYWLLQLKRL